MKSSSRRGFFRYMAILGLVTWSASPLLAKETKEKLMYQDSPKDGKNCAECLHFLPKTNECKLVEGSISPNGWCMMYFKDTRKKS